MKTIGELLKQVETELAESQIENALTESEWLLGEVLGRDRTGLYLNREAEVAPEEEERLRALLERRKQREPLQYVLSKTEFRSCTLKVEEGVFIPRPESEQLVDQTNTRIDEEHTRVIDIGTGSGVLAIALAAENPRCQVTAVDISAKAIMIAHENARLNNVVEQVQFVTGDFRSPDLDLGEYDIVVSNPPYVKAGEIDGLQPEISWFEPRAALDGGDDGLGFYRTLAQWCGKHLRSGGWLCLEMGDGLCEEVKRILDQTTGFGHIEVKEDYREVERIILALKND